MTDLLTEVLTESRDLGFLGPGPIQPHIDHAAAFAEVVDQSPAGPPARALDLGAGGGLPGLVLASTAWPATRWTFLDAQHRRTTFLERAVRTLGVDQRVTVLTARAEEVGRDPDHRGRYDLVTSRSFGAPGVTAECAAPLLEVGGLLVVSEPPVDEGDRWPDDGVARVGFGKAERLVVDGDQPTTLVRMALLVPVDDLYPRRTGVPGRRPLF